MSAGLTVQVVRWVDDEPQPGWVEATFTDAHGETWHFFDKSPILEAPGSPVLTREQSYPVVVVLPVEVIEERASDVGRVAIIRLPWGLDYELAKDTFEVAASDLVR